MTACYDPTHPQVPERPERLTGPEIGTLCRIVSKYDWLANRVVRVLARSYVWAPEQHNPNGTHGSRRYMDAVIEYGPGKRLVVLQSELIPLQPGDVIEA